MTTFDNRPSAGTTEPASFAWIFPGQDYSEVANAIGGFPPSWKPVLRSPQSPGEQVWSTVDWSPNPRSAMGFKDGHTMLFWTVDGRTAMGDGLTTPALMKPSPVGEPNMRWVWMEEVPPPSIFSCSINGVVNFPSDNKKTDHNGLRPVSDGVYVR